ncbi:hypothetical protein DFH29DRAFT_814090, partial [Suillus ampliporus]
VQFGEDLSPDELDNARKLVGEYADIFVGSLKEVLLVPGVVNRLIIPDGTTFNL